ncbi:uncharacterized protein LACBIDRAFT_314015 [Laccaria bicolor S238N-H82]|uniref:Predicted protein n=1 Tax=Laccaria bicolor (strain S238N-H82 / ATCC MYA-4686) TaxID=486041 RepID=B0D1D8_LACBS|nr:uncharacterized protein LACBIDRAFT_314015 [Laccaria bicolor S238N-H82]EDR11615.1 predicted protein [Laccaria bicolor S238N-H82]|eukprot:XP_001877512.1 predicted protein [Laccaria bicolor S238N-H82]
MGKKQKDDVPNINSVANRDIIQRLNFMYQASVYLQSLSTSASTSSTSSADSMDQSGVPPCEASGSITEPSSPQKSAKGKRRRVIGRKKTVNDLARSYVHALKVVGQKTTVKMDPSIKRTLCKGCNVVLVPGSTAFVRVKRSSSHGHSVVYTCTGCKTSRRIPAPPTAHSPSQPELTQPQTPTATPLLQEILTAHDPSQPKAELPATNETLVPHRKCEKKATLPRLPPLFARQDAGHVTFRGNERLPEIDWEKGHGMFLV